MRRAAVSLIPALLVAACTVVNPTGAPSPTPTSTPSPVTAPTAAASEAPPIPTTPPSPTAAPTPTPTPSASPIALDPPAELGRVAVVERDGIRLRVELERNPMPAGRVSRVTTVVRNLEDRPLHWLSDGCAIPVSVSGEATQAWPIGETHDQQGQLFKDLVMDRWFAKPPFPGPLADFVPPSHLGTGAFGCADIGIVHTIKPHGSVRSVQAWDGQAALRFGPFPAGPVELTGSFGAYWREKEMPDYDQTGHLRFSLPAWVTGGPGGDWIGPVGAVDAALADPGFVAWLQDQNITSGRDEIAWYRPERDVWEVGLLAWYDAPTPQLHLVEVDPHTGAVLRTVDRPWDQRLDGFP